MSPLPRALHRARLWTVGALSASTLLVGAIGVHLADAQTQTVAASTSGTTSSSSSSSSGTSSSTNQSDTSSSDTSSSHTSSSDTSSSHTSGFSAVAPVSNGNGQAQTSSGGS